MKFEPDSGTQGEDETLSAQALSYALDVPGGETGEVAAMINAAWALFAEEMGEESASTYQDDPDTAILAEDVAALTEALVPEAPSITIANSQATIIAEDDAAIYYTTNGRGGEKQPVQRGCRRKR